MVEDEVAETGPLPLVFLSYQWGTQNEVRLLKQHLESAGYRCWMDLGQMGGGDKLFAKIDAGMRAAKVVICCVTNKYSQSDNCTREVGYNSRQKCFNEFIFLYRSALMFSQFFTEVL